MMLCREIVLVSLFMAVAAARNVKNPVQRNVPITTDVNSCNTLKEELLEALGDYAQLQRMELLEAVQHEINSTLSDYTKLRGFQEEELLRRENIGQSWKYPAYSCREIAERKPQNVSGHYWVQTCRLSPPVQVYCDLEKVLDNSKGWMRVANLDMTDPHQQCPPGFNFISSTGKRLCGRSTSGGGCNSVTFETLGVQYQKVCGRVIGYQYGSTDAFNRLNRCPSPCTIDHSYVDGVSITHGNQPRKHVWTYAAGLVELEYEQYQCPCSSVPGVQPPSFVGSDYYCESGLYTGPWSQVLYASDTLWDGQRCNGYEGPCCSPPTSRGSVRSSLNQPLMTWKFDCALTRARAVKTFQLNWWNSTFSRCYLPRSCRKVGCRSLSYKTCIVLYIT